MSGWRDPQKQPWLTSSWVHTSSPQLFLMMNPVTTACARSSALTAMTQLPLAAGRVPGQDRDLGSAWRSAKKKSPVGLLWERRQEACWKSELCKRCWGALAGRAFCSFIMHYLLLLFRRWDPCGKVLPGDAYTKCLLRHPTSLQQINTGNQKKMCLLQAQGREQKRAGTVSSYCSGKCMSEGEMTMPILDITSLDIPSLMASFSLHKMKSPFCIRQLSGPGPA